MVIGGETVVGVIDSDVVIDGRVTAGRRIFDGISILVHSRVATGRNILIDSRTVTGWTIVIGSDTVVVTEIAVGGDLEFSGISSCVGE